MYLWDGSRNYGIQLDLHRRDVTPKAGRTVRWGRSYDAPWAH